MQPAAGIDWDEAIAGPIVDEMGYRYLESRGRQPRHTAQCGSPASAVCTFCSKTPPGAGTVAISAASSRIVSGGALGSIKLLVTSVRVLVERVLECIHARSPR